VNETNGPARVTELKCLETLTEIHKLSLNLPQSMASLPRSMRGAFSRHNGGVPIPTQAVLSHASTPSRPHLGTRYFQEIWTAEQAQSDGSNTSRCRDARMLGCEVGGEASLRGGRIRATGAQPLSCSWRYSHRPCSWWIGACKRLQIS
jgi:hypothetical protein